MITKNTQQIKCSTHRRSYSGKLEMFSFFYVMQTFLICLWIIASEKQTFKGDNKPLVRTRRETRGGLMSLSLPRLNPRPLSSSSQQSNASSPLVLVTSKEAGKNTPANSRHYQTRACIQSQSHCSLQARLIYRRCHRRTN